MNKICQRTNKKLTDDECLERIQKTVNIKSLRICRHCITAKSEKHALVQEKLLAVDAQSVFHRQKVKNDAARRKSDLEMITLPPSRVCRTCGMPTNGFECKACRAKRREKGVWA